MTSKQANELLLQENFPDKAIAQALPMYFRYKNNPLQFRSDFGLSELPEEPGLISIRGARQYGKSTWLETEIFKTRKDFGPGSALYLNGDIIVDFKELISEIEILVALQANSTSTIKRIFIDEITSVKDWQRAIKYLVDRGILSQTLVVATGSSASDLRHGNDLLPGRKGKLKRTEFIFTPISYPEYLRVCQDLVPKDDLLPLYIISGASPIAITELVTNRIIPDYVLSLTKDWIVGAVIRTGRSRQALLALINALYANGASTISYNKLARDTGLGNNTTAQGYLEILADSLAVAPCLYWDYKRSVAVIRKQAKFHFINLLVASVFHKPAVRTVEQYKSLPESVQGVWIEWLVAQEIFRRQAIRGDDVPERFCYYSHDDHEVDFVLSPHEWVEVKRGQISPHELGFVPQDVNLTVICSNKLSFNRVKCSTLEEFLIGG